jgi:hypothetical protein
VEVPRVQGPESWALVQVAAYRCAGFGAMDFPQERVQLNSLA